MKERAAPEEIWMGGKNLTWGKALPCWESFSLVRKLLICEKLSPRGEEPEEAGTRLEDLSPLTWVSLLGGTVCARKLLRHWASGCLRKTFEASGSSSEAAKPRWAFLKGSLDPCLEGGVPRDAPPSEGVLPRA